MTDPGASADSQQPGATEPALPDSAGDPQSEGAANPPHDPADVGSASGIEASASRFEIVPA